MYRVFRNKWITPPQAVETDYSGKNIVITGGTSGIGEEAAYRFAALGASKVIIAARDVKKGEKTKAALDARLKGRGKDRLEVCELDMMSYDSVVAFAERVRNLEHVDIVVLNAGTRRTKFHESDHGWEEDLQVNALSNTLLALLLLPKLKESKKITGKTPVLEFVNSGLHQNAVVPPETRTEPNILAHYNKRENFREGKQYSFSKAFLMYTTTYLAETISSEDVIITSICPGWVNTNLGRDHFFPGVFVVAFFFILLFMRTPAQGANMVLSGTVQGEKVHNRFWQHDRIQPISPILKGEAMKEFGTRIFNEIVAALEAGGQDMQNVLGEALATK